MTPVRKPAAAKSRATPKRVSNGGAGNARAGGGKCPICGKPGDTDYSPFCSKRCADIDLNRWLSGHYAVPGEPLGSQPAPDEDDDGGTI